MKPLNTIIRTLIGSSIDRERALRQLLPSLFSQNGSVTSYAGLPLVYPQIARYPVFLPRDERLFAVDLFPLSVKADTFPVLVLTLGVKMEILTTGRRKLSTMVGRTWNRIGLMPPVEVETDEAVLKLSIHRGSPLTRLLLAR